MPNPTTPPLNLPARTTPVPTTVAPEMQHLIAAPLNPLWNLIPPHRGRMESSGHRLRRASNPARLARTPRRQNRAHQNRRRQSPHPHPGHHPAGEREPLARPRSRSRRLLRQTPASTAPARSSSRPVSAASGSFRSTTTCRPATSAATSTPPRPAWPTRKSPASSPNTSANNRIVCYLRPSARVTASGSRAITRNRVRTGPTGIRRRLSYCLTVATENPNRAANAA